MASFTVVYLLFFLVPLIHTLNRPYENPKYFEGDIILTPEERRNIYKANNAYGASMKKWPTKTIVYDFAPDIEKEIGATQEIHKAINDFHRYTCLKFVRRTTEKAYIHFYNGKGCGAPLGYRNGVHKVSLEGPACWKKGTIVHEVLHTLGFYHEQSRPDRDKYIEIIWDNISSEDMKSNFEKQPQTNVDSMGSSYDYLSIMHYHKDGFAKRGTITIRTLDPTFQDRIGQRNGFSSSDLYQINKLYQCGTNFATNSPITSIYPVCVDKNENCAFYSRYCQDKSWFDFMLKECKFTCSLCGSALVTTGPTQPVLTTKPSSTGCVDKQVKTCSDYKQYGYCKSTSPALIRYMKENCKRSCNYCN